MSAVNDLLVVHRAIDAAIAHDHTGRVRALAAKYFPLYADESTLGWTTTIQSVLGKRPAEPTADEPVLATTDDVPPVPRDELNAALERLGAHRAAGMFQRQVLLGLAVLGRLPSTDEDIGLQFDVNAFRQAVAVYEPLRPTEDIGRSLIDVLLDDQFLPDVQRWPEFAEFAVRSQVLAPDVPVNVPSCVDSMTYEVIGGDEQPVTRLWTSVRSASITDEQVEAFSDPMNWPPCNHLYCMMRNGGPSGAGNLYTEVLSPDCEQDPANHDDTVDGHIVVGLVFTLDRRVNGYKLSYDIAAPPNEGNGRVLVDHGDILVQKLNGAWTFTATKYLRFNGVLDGAPLAMFACVMGYGQYALDFLAKLEGSGQRIVTDNPTDNPVEPTPSNPERIRRGPMSTDLTKMLDDLAAWAQGRIAVYADAASTTINKVLDNEYSGDDLSSDVTSAIGRLTEDVTSLLQILPISSPQSPDQPNP